MSIRCGRLSPHLNLAPPPIFDVVHVQIAWHRGWHALINGAGRTIEKDNIGLMAIDPGVTGPCRIELNYDGGREMRIAHWLSALSVILLVVLSLLNVSRGILKKS